MKKGHLVILLVEDEEHDVFFLKRAAEQSGAGHEVVSVSDGAEAIRYLKGEGPFSDRHSFPQPNIIMTDLKMPGMDGFDFLSWLRKHPECGIIPTVVYSSSTLESDIVRAYRAGANAYLSKPSGLDELKSILRNIYEFWSLCECPKTPHKC